MAKAKTFVLSDESVNTYGFRLLLSGADIEQFRRNPVMYLNHNDWGTPIGRWENIRIEDGKLMADPVFDLEDEEGKKIAGKVDRGFLRMASVGLRAIERSEEPKLMLPGQKYPTVTKWQLREASIVGIGANHNAIRLYDENDRLLSDDEILKLFDKTKPVNFEQKMKKETFTLLSLADNASDEQLHDAIRLIVEENTRLKSDKKTLSDKLQKIEDDAKAAQKAEAVKLTDAAIKEGRLNAQAREATLKQFDNDFEATKTMLEAIPARTTLKDAIAESDKSELEKLSAMSWDELDKSGKLKTLRDKYPDTYKEKFDEQFKKS
ncbi:hypothetical protein SAMN05216357_112123 [Porphyromonadaceae bacterium KH3CP3RA]|nr:hypothetical protein SAMN05216357_112123 [Porphyromonadaceae bacterium KH3CP3RA]